MFKKITLGTSLTVFGATCFAAVPAAVTTAVSDAAVDGATVAAAVLVAIVGIFAIKLMRRAL